MRRSAIVLALVLVLIRASAASADEDDPLRIVQRAIDACGGVEKLKPGRCGYSRVEGKLFTGGGEIPIQGEAWTEYPNRCKGTVRCMMPKGQQRQTVAIVDAAGWVQTDDKPATDLDAATLTTQRDILYQGYVTQLLPLLADKEFVLTLIGKEQIGGRSSTGVRVARPGWPAVDLWFDHSTSLLMRTVWRTPGGVLQEEQLSGYTELRGAMRPTAKALYHDGIKVMQVRVVEFKPLDKLDDELLKKP